MLAPGAQIGKYEILEHIGAGGMGEVWKARDTVLGRDVAIKTLPAELADDPERLARLEREARILAALNHPNIAGIRGLEKSGGSSFLELELIEGETLGGLLERGPASIERSLEIALQIADALEAAHAEGIVHRDLKPGNVMLRPDGTVKVLDFGLAKTVPQIRAGTSGPDRPTASMTRDGAIVGTPAYMSPEQVRGKPVDTQTDIWAFGCILYEMLTGWPPFGGPSEVETLGRVLERDPDLSALPAQTPAPVRRLIRRCLEKEPKNRLHHISDARLDIREAGDAAETLSPDTAREASRGPHTRRTLGIAGVTALVLIAAASGWLLAGRPPPAAIGNAAVYAAGPPVPAPLVVSGDRLIAISPDGVRLAYTSAGSIWLQTLGRQDAEPVANGGQPFFSADGEWVGFLDADGGGLSRVSVAERATIPVTGALQSGRILGGAWVGDTIVFAAQSGLYRVSAAAEGGEPTLLIPSPEGQTFGWPQLLSDGTTVVLTVLSGESAADSSIVLLDLETLELSPPVVRGAVGARYAATVPGIRGHLIYANAEGRLATRELDPVTREIGAGPVEIPNVAVEIAGTYLGAAFDVSDTGTLVHVEPRARSDVSAVWVDRAGNEETLPGALPGMPSYPRVSPDGDRVAITIGLGTTGRRIWVMDRERGVPVQLSDRDTSGTIYEEFESIWSRDGRRIFFTSLRSGEMRIWSHAADGSGSDAMLVDDPDIMVPLATTPDDRLLVLLGPGGRADIGLLDPDDPAAVERLTDTSFREFTPSLSPDGRWIAYASNELGDRFEIYVEPLLGDGARLRVSANGGVHPLWDPDGSGNLYYIGRDEAGEPAMLAARLELSPAARVVDERTLFRKDYFDLWVDGGSLRPYDISPLDGRFLLPRVEAGPGSDEMTVWVTLNWTAVL